MAINSNVPDRLAREALATGGMRRPLQGQDVLETDPRQLDLELLPEAELDAIEQVTPTDTEEIEVPCLAVGHLPTRFYRVLKKRRPCSVAERGRAQQIARGAATPREEELCQR